MGEPEDFIVSPETLERMKSELEELTTTGRETISERLRRAREFGDVRENADLDAAKDAQGLMEARIRRLQHMIGNAVVRETPADVEVATAGLVVTVRDIDSGDTEDYLLAASAEERIPGVSTASTASPLGSAILGKRVGEKVVVRAPGGEFSVEVVDLKPA